MQAQQQPRNRQRETYPRENYFGDGDTDEYDALDGDGGAHFVVGKPTREMKIEWMATELLKEGATFLDPVVVMEDPDECPHNCEAYEEDGECDHESYALHNEDTAAELSPPLRYVREDPSQQVSSYGLYKRRENPECGHLVSGGLLKDRKLREFLGIIEDWLGELERRGRVSASDRADLEHQAKQLKRDDELRDRQILRVLVREVL